MRAFIYTRVSSDPNNRGRSVGEQETELRAVCDRNGWDVVRVYTDNDRSASRYAKKDRPEYIKLIAAIDAGECDVLVTWEASRAQRDISAYATLRDLCATRGVLWSYSGRTFDMSDADDRLGSGLDALLAERESDQTQSRVLRAVRANAAAGRPHGKLLYGYRRVYDPTTGELAEQLPNEKTAPVVREAARRVLAGETPYAVAQDFNRRGIPTSRGGVRGWDLIQIKRMCVNPGYAGLRVHRGKVIGSATWPALIDEGTHHSLVARLNDPARRTNRETAIRHLLSGIAVCDVCDGRVRVQKNRGSLTYLCVDGFHVARNEKHADAVVEAAVIARLGQPDLLRLMSAGDGASKASEALTEVREKRARLDSFYDAAAAGELTPAALARIESTLLPQIEAAEKAAARAGMSTAVADAAGPDAADGWSSLSLPQKREIISTLMTVRLIRTGKGNRTFRPEHIQIEWRTS